MYMCCTCALHVLYMYFDVTIMCALKFGTFGGNFFVAMEENFELFFLFRINFLNKILMSVCFFRMRDWPEKR